MFEAKGASRSEFFCISFRRDFHFDSLSPDGRREIDFAGQPERVVGQNADFLVAILNGHRAADPEVFSSPAQLPESHAPQKINERFAAAIEYRNLKIVNLDRGVIHGETVKSAKQMLSGRNQNALAHQTGGIADPFYMFPACRYGEIVQVGAFEDDACSGLGRRDAKFGDDAGVQSRPGNFDGTVNGSFELKQSFDFPPENYILNGAGGTDL